MAEIHVEPKKNTSSSTWIWIVLVLLIAAAVIYYLVSRNNNTNPTNAPANTVSYISLPEVVAANTLYLC